MNAFLLVAVLVLAAEDGGTRAVIQFPADKVKFVAAPNLPKGSTVALLEGDPKKPGLFTMRIKVPKGFRLPLHTHPQDERVTVLEGSVSVEFAGKITTFPQGSFYVTPAGLPHTVWSDSGATLQMTGQGPWVVTPAAP